MFYSIPHIFFAFQFLLPACFVLKLFVTHVQERVRSERGRNLRLRVECGLLLASCIPRLLVKVNFHYFLTCSLISRCLISVELCINDDDDNDNNNNNNNEYCNKFSINKSDPCVFSGVRQGAEGSWSVISAVRPSPSVHTYAHRTDSKVTAGAQGSAVSFCDKIEDNKGLVIAGEGG